MTPLDGIEPGVPGVSVSRVIQDLEAPAAPTIDPIAEHRNEDEVSLTGTCELGCTVFFSCEDSGGAFVEEGPLCSALGDFEYTVPLARGDVTTCFATCFDDAGNESPSSNLVVTEVCDPYDMYEDDSTYGDLSITAIDEWLPIPDDASMTIPIVGNVLTDDQTDWYLLFSQDDVTADMAAGVDTYNFDVSLIAGAGTYSFLVFRGGDGMECPDEWSVGYTEYNHFSDDVGDGSHEPPADPRQCGGPTDNQCSDFSTYYYVQILRSSLAPYSCEHYELEVTNGVW